MRRIRGSGARKGNAYFVHPKVNVKISKGSGPENTKGARVGYVSRVSEAGDGPVIGDVKERAWEPIFGTAGGAPIELLSGRKDCWRRRADVVLKYLARNQNWPRAEARRRRALVSELLSQYQGAVVKTARLGYFARLFALWHVLHLPLFFLLIVSAIAHVIAVHLY